jgi:hypothetical protein
MSDWLDASNRRDNILLILFSATEIFWKRKEVMFRICLIIIIVSN